MKQEHPRIWLLGLSFRAFGFVHVTNLPAGREDFDEPRPIVANPAHHLHHGSNNYMQVAVLQDGEVWLRMYPETPDDQIEALIEKLLDQLCPKGIGAFVPCSNGESVPSRMLFARHSDPTWTNHGQFKAIMTKQHPDNQTS